MKKFLIVIAMATIALLSGCNAATYAINSATVSASVLQLSSQLDSVSLTIEANKDVFTAPEQIQLAVLESDLRELKTAGQDLIRAHGDIGTVLVKADQVKTLFTSAKLAYIEAKAIIEPKLQSLPAAVQVELIVFDQNARQLNLSLTTLLKTPGADITQAVTDVLTLGATAARLSRLAVL